MVRFSVVILHLDTPELLEKSLLSVLPDRGTEDEVLVVCSRPYADPYQLAEEVQFLEASGANWAEAANQGIRAARAPLVQLIQAGTEITLEASQLALRHFADPHVVAVGAWTVDDQNAQRFLRAGWTLTAGGRIRPVRISRGSSDRGSNGAASSEADCPSAALPILAPDPACAIVRKQVVLTWGGFPRELTPQGAWLEMGLAMQAAGFRLLAEPACTARIPRPLLLKPSARQLARDAERLFWQWTPRPIGLGRLCRHLLAVLGEWLASGPTPTGLAQLLGRLAGLRQGLRMPPGRARALRLFQHPEKSSIPPPHFQSSARRDRTAFPTHRADKNSAVLFPQR